MATVSKFFGHWWDIFESRIRQVNRAISNEGGVPFMYCSMKLHILLGTLLALCSIKKQVKSAPSHEKLCNLWSNSTKYEYDMVVAVTDDYSYVQGQREDMTFVHAFRKLGHKATRISIHDDDFDWNTTKMVVIRSAWGKYYYQACRRNACIFESRLWDCS